MNEPITSSKNPKIKSAFKLRDKKERQRRGVFAFEGAREILRAIKSGYEISELYACQDFFSAESKEVMALVDSKNIYPITKAVFTKLALRDSVDGLWAVVEYKNQNLSDLATSKNQLILGLYGAEKPGNLGALFRTADGVGASAVVILEECSDPFNHNSIRTSLGAIFSVPSVKSNTAEFIKYCRTNGIQVVAAALVDSTVEYTKVDFSKPTAILLGAEDNGLPHEVIEKCDHTAKIPMNGIADSLNVSVAGAVILYEALRQRS